MADIATLGIRIDTSQAKAATTDLDKLTDAGKKVEQSVDKIADAGKTAAAGIKEAGSAAKGSSTSIADFAKTTERGGMSAKQYTAALRGVPAQFTDIATSLASGQAPLTVFLQQGGQLKDMFGGAGNAARALSGYMIGLLTPVNLTIAAVAGLTYAFYEGSQEQQRYQKALILSGNIAGTTSDQLEGMARNIDNVSGTQSAAAAALTAFAASGAVGADSLEKFALSAIKFESATGTAIEETVEKFAQLKKAPLEASIKLNESMNYLTRSVYDQIKALEEQGKTTEAAKVAQDAFADANNSRSAEIIANMGLVESSWAAVKKVIKETGDAILDIGRPATAEDQVAILEKRIAQIRTRSADIRNISGNRAGANEIAQLEKEIALVKQRAAADDAKAIAEAASGKALKDREKFDKEIERSLSNELRLKKEIIKAEGEYGAMRDAGTISQKEYEAAIAGVKSRFSSKSTSGKSAGTPDTTYARLLDDIDKATIGAQEYLQTGERLSTAESFRLDMLKRMEEIRTKGKQTIGELVEAEGRMNDAYELQVQALQQAENARIKEEDLKRMEAYQKSLDDQNRSIYESNAALGEQIAEIGLTTEAVNRLRLARMDETISQKEKTLATAAATGKTYEEIAALETELKLLKEKRELTSQGQIAQAAADSEKESQAASKDFADTMRNDLKGAFSAAFRDSSGDPLKAFGDALENVIFSRAATALSEAAYEGLAGIAGSIGGGSGAGIGDLIGNLLSFDGGGSTGSGARSGGIDGKGGFLSILHPQETVLDHTKGQTGTGGGVSVVQNISIDSRSDQATIISAMQEAKRQTLAAIQQSRRAGGVYA